VNPFEPAPTPLDLKWRLFGINFRVHPSFWFVGLIFGMMGGGNLPRELIFTYIVVWMIAMFLAVLVHELGHVCMGRIFGEHGNILLYSMGGYATGFYDRLERWQRILVAAAGPIAGFLFLIAVVVFDNFYWNGLFAPSWLDVPALRTPWSIMFRAAPNYWAEHDWYYRLISDLVVMNLFWSLINLIPVVPLDGGNILREVCTGLSPRSGLRTAFGISFVVAGCAALYSAFKYQEPKLPYPPLDPLFNIILFGMLAFQSFAMLRAVEAQQRQWESYDE
jgi:stage IV sporulation protein FB